MRIWWDYECKKVLKTLGPKSKDLGIDNLFFLVQIVLLEGAGN